MEERTDNDVSKKYVKIINIFMIISSFKEWVWEKGLLLQENARVADFLNRAADGIARMTKPNQTVVILGRDAWALVPLLKHRGIKVQYFLYSRLQIGDEATKQAWLREVPRKSLVVDTGYAGSIINDIKNFDPTVTGVLLSSKGQYPEVRIDGPKLSHEDIVDEIEHTPKLINRSLTFRGPYVVTTKPKYSDDFGMPTGVKNVVDQNQELLRNAGLPEDIVQQYKKFSGISPKQRLGHEDYITHLMKVGVEREKAGEESKKEEEKWKKRWNKVIDLAWKGKKTRWSWSEVPNQFRYMLSDNVSRALNHLNDLIWKTKNELSDVKPWDTEHLQEVQEKLQELYRAKKGIEDLYYSSFSYGKYS